MKLIKRGLRRNHGERTVFYEKDIEPSFHSDNMTIYTSGREMAEGMYKHSNSTYSFRLMLSYEDVANIIGAIEIRNKESKALNQNLRKVLLDKKEKLLQLLMLTSDFFDEESQEKE